MFLLQQNLNVLEETKLPTFLGKLGQNNNIILGNK